MILFAAYDFALVVVHIDGHEDGLVRSAVGDRASEAVLVQFVDRVIGTALRGCVEHGHRADLQTIRN